MKFKIISFILKMIIILLLLLLMSLADFKWPEKEVPKNKDIKFDSKYVV